MHAVQYGYSPTSGGQPAYSNTRATAAVPQDPSKQPVPKNVAFELLLDENSKVRARIPMRVQIYPHDTTDSIVTTVKNFYGIYDGTASGVSFEDDHANTLIARYENLRNNMTVYVRVIPVLAYSEPYAEPHYGSMATEGRKRPSLGEPFQMAPVLQPAPVWEQGQSPSHPACSIARKRSMSPSNRSRRSVSQHKQSRAGIKNRASSTHGSFHGEETPEYSDSDGGYGSATGSKRARSEQHFASSEISMENILQDGRRKRPKFESSELPLFVPPQVPITTSASSISPQRRSVGQEMAGSPFARPMQRPYTFQQPLPSPQSFGYNEQAYGPSSARNSMYATPVIPEHGHRLRDRTGPQFSGQFSNSAGGASGPGILPTPDPTIASCISDEDVAMQLIRLGDASNFSHGRTSASTMDDAFSGAADAASSTGATTDGEDFSEEDDDLPARGRQLDSPMLGKGGNIVPSAAGSDASYEGNENEPNGTIKDELDADARKAKKAKVRATSTASSKACDFKPAASKTNKIPKNPSASRKAKGALPTGVQKPVAPHMASPAPTRKTSTSSANPSLPLAADEEDLSSKPRCQRCRKSKKGCDRQRPCGRCKDAGIGIDGCISEDEGNGRKSTYKEGTLRFGRHMGVPVKKSLDDISASPDPQPAIAPAPVSTANADKSKKRKR